MFVDEVQTSTLRNEGSVLAKMRNNIAEPTIEIRRMYATPVEVRNYSNWILASNMPDPVKIRTTTGATTSASTRQRSSSSPSPELDKLERKPGPYNYFDRVPSRYGPGRAGAGLPGARRPDRHRAQLGRRHGRGPTGRGREFFVSQLPAGEPVEAERPRDQPDGRLRIRPADPHRPHGREDRPMPHRPRRTVHTVRLLRRREGCRGRTNSPRCCAITVST